MPLEKRTIVLGEREYEIVELKARKNAGWRNAVETQLAPLLELIELAGKGMELRSSVDIMRLANQIGPLLVKAPDVVNDLLFAYAPNLAADREQILDGSYDSELAAAFVTVLGLAYPFGGLVKLASLASGSLATTSAETSKNSPAPNGEASAKR